MNQNQLDRVLRLINKTGDKMLIMDKTTDNIFALMNLDSYEDLVLEDFDYNDGFDPEGDFDSDFYPSKNPDSSNIFNRDNEEDFFSEDDIKDLSAESDLEGPFLSEDSLEDLDLEEEKQEENKESEIPKDEEIKLVPIKQANEQSPWVSVGKVLSEEKLDDLVEEKLEENEEEDKFYLEPIE